MKRIFILILITFIYTSCESEFEISDFKLSSKLVVLSIFSPEEPWRVDVSQSYSIFEEPSKEELLISDAQVKITEILDDGTSSSYFLDFNGEYYTTDSKVPHANLKYVVEVFREGFETATATSICPVEIKISEKSFSDGFNVNDNKYYFDIDVNVEANDIQSTDIYSMGISIDTLGEIRHYDKLTELSLKTTDDSFDFVTFFDSFSKVLNLSWDSYTIINEPVLSNVKDYYEIMGIEIGQNDDRDNNDQIFIKEKKYQTIVYIFSLSNEYFQYATSIRNYISAKGSPITNKDRPNLYSNVNGGYGLFSGVAVEFFIE